MKKPNPWKHESWLRRLFDSSRFESVIYFEEAVLADSDTLGPKGYYIFVVTETSLHFLQQSGKDSTLHRSNSWLLTDFHSIHHLNDAATFFAENPEVAQTSRHIRCCISDQVASPWSLLDFYSFYEDTSIYTYLFQAWQQAHVRLALPMFYTTINERNKLSKLTKLGVQALFMHLETQLLATAKDDDDDEPAATAATPADASALAAATPKRLPRPGEARLVGDTDGDGIDDTRIKSQAALLRAKRKKASDHEYWNVRLRTKILEEMTLVVATHRCFKQFSFDSPNLIPFLLSQLRNFSKFRSYLLGADPKQIWSYTCKNEDMLLEDEVDRLRLNVAIWNFLSKLLAGSECIPERMKLLAWNSTSTERELKEVMDALFLLGGIPIYGDRSMMSSPSAAASASSSAPTPGGSILPPGSRFVNPSKFLEHLDRHLETYHHQHGDSSSSSTLTRSKLIDEDDERYKQKYLYNLRMTRKWKEGILQTNLENVMKTGSSGASSSSSSNQKMKLHAQASSLHIKDVPKIIQTRREEHAALMSRRGPIRQRRGEVLERDLLLRQYDQPPLAEEIGYETVIVTNEGAERVGLEKLREVIPELEVSFLEMMFHFQQLLEYTLEIRTTTSATSMMMNQPTLTFNLENLFKHLLEPSNGDGTDFKQLQIPVFARGLVYMCQKERRETISYYTFVYASVLSKFILRSSELQMILKEQHFFDLLTIDHTAAATAAAAAQQRTTHKSNTLALLPDIKHTSMSASSKGMHFYQRTKPLLENMVKLLDG